MTRPRGDERPEFDGRAIARVSYFRGLYLRLRRSGGQSRINAAETSAPPYSAAARTPRPHNGGGSREQIPSASLVVGVTQDERPDLRERLSPAGLDTLEVAQAEARFLGHRRVGTEHLLLALTRNAESGACTVMERMGATPARVRADVLSAIVTGAAPISGPLAFTPRARLAVELAHRASARIGVPRTGTEHLLIGLAAEGEGIAAKALHKSGILARTAENQVTADLDGKTPAP